MDGTNDYVGESKETISATAANEFKGYQLRCQKQ